MERLTSHDENMRLLINEEERLLSSKGFIDKDEMYKIMRHLAEKLSEYEDLEEQGRLLKLPCAVGDRIWDISLTKTFSYVVSGFSFGSLYDDDWEEEKTLDQVVVYYTNSNGSITGTFAVSEIGKTVFLTKSAAEQALKEMEGKK